MTSKSDAPRSILKGLLERGTTWRSRTAVVHDRTRWLAAMSTPSSIQVRGSSWSVVRADSFLNVRRHLWDTRPERVCVLSPARQLPKGFRDLTQGAARIEAGAAAILSVSRDVHLPDDPRMDLLLNSLLDESVPWDILPERDVRQSELSGVLVSVLAGTDLVGLDKDSEVLAAILRRNVKILSDATQFAESFAAGLSGVTGELVRGLLTFGERPATVARALLEAAMEYDVGNLVTDQLVQAFLAHATEGSKQQAIGDYADAIRQALFADRDWGAEWVAGLPSIASSRYADIRPEWLEGDIQSQVEEVAAGRRLAVDESRWQGHLCRDRYVDWVAVARRAARLSQAMKHIDTLCVDEAVGLTDIVRSYCERIAAEDLAWIELDQRSKLALPLQEPVREIRSTYVRARTRINKMFAQRYVEAYPRLLYDKEHDLVAQLLLRKVLPALEDGSRVLVVVVDALSYALWQRFRADLRADGWYVTDGYGLAMLPTITRVSRQALFSGPSVKEIYAGLDEGGDSPSADVDEKRAMGRLLEGYSNVLFRKRELRDTLSQVCQVVKDTEPQVVGVIVNEVDDRLGSKEGTPLGCAISDHDMLSVLMHHAKESGRHVFVTADHGFTPCAATRHTVRRSDDADYNARSWRPPCLAGDASLPAIVCQDPIYPKIAPFAALWDFGGRITHHPRPGYHGGITLEEVVVPAAWLRMRAGTATFDIKFRELPDRVTEEERVQFTVVVSAIGDIQEGLQLTVRGPSLDTVVADVVFEPGESRRVVPVTWVPVLRSQEAPREVAVIRATCEGLKGQQSVVEQDVVVEPRRGKYTSAVDAMLP